MSGFEWNTFYTHLEKKMKKAYPACKVGRYITPKQTDFPYCDVALSDISGGNYDLEGNEGAQTPMITVSVYDTGSIADNTCYTICNKVKEIMLKYGWQCKYGPLPVANAADPNVSRWVIRFQRIYANGDEIEEVKTE
jgi:hypothetical protein